MAPSHAQLPQEKRDASPGAARLTLVLGGARSGKSRHAEALITALPPPWTYVATGQALDDEMAARIAEHRSRRDPRWRTVEAPRDVAGAVERADGPALVDCLTLWLSNWMSRDEKFVERQIDLLCSAFRDSTSHIRAITNEVGSSIVPDNPLARRFRDWSGLLNQRVAAVAESVVLMVCGIPIRVK